MTSDAMGFVPPHNFEAEQSVLGGLMLRADSFHDLGLSERDFYSRPHQIIFGAISQLIAAKQPIDIMTVQHRIEQDGELDVAGSGCSTNIGCSYMLGGTDRVWETLEGGIPRSSW